MSKTNMPTVPIQESVEIDKSIFIKTPEEKEQLKKLKSEWKKSQKK